MIENNPDELWGIAYNLETNRTTRAPLDKIKDDPSLVWEGTRRECFLFLKRMHEPLMAANSKRKEIK